MLKATGEGLSGLSQLLSVPGVPCLWPHHPSLCLHLHMAFLPHVYIQIWGGGKIPVCIRPTLIQHDPILTNFIYKDLISK